MLWMKNGQKTKVTNCSPIGNTQKLNRFHLTGAPRGVHFPVFNGIFDLRYVSRRSAAKADQGLAVEYGGLSRLIKRGCVPECLLERSGLVRLRRKSRYRGK